MFAKNIMYSHVRKLAAAVVAIGIALPASAPALSQEVTPSLEATNQEIEAIFGKFPTFLEGYPKIALPGAWASTKALEFNGDTALTAREKALISLAVSAQIPCQYCIWADTVAAEQYGATKEQIGEAVAIAALARHWSTVFHGLQVDLRTFQEEIAPGKMASKKMADQ